MSIHWQDTADRYGLVSRSLHWGMAALFLIQFLGMITEAILGETPFTKTLNSQHSAIGALILLLAALRILWALLNRARRGTVNPLARLGHLALYVLMFTVPALALLRAYGSGRGFSPFGLQLFPATGQRIEWMVAPASALHGPLAWALLVLIAGHVTMALAHRFIWRDDTLTRMAG